MRYYRVFGGVLGSEIHFPELTPTSAAPPDWTLTRGRNTTALPRRQVVGVEELAGGVTARLERGADTLRLQFDDSGTFDLSAGGARITWTPAADVSPALVRSDLLGRVLSLAFHVAGDLALHASAVAIDEQAIVIAGEKGHGKSTLAMALVRAGGRLLADDTVRLTIDPVSVAPGVPILRLRGDSAARFGLDPADLPSAPGDKVLVDAASDAHDAWLPIGATYLLAPRAPRVGVGALTRRTLTTTEATLALVRHGKAAALLGKGEAGVVLARAAAVARRTPVFALELARDLSSIDAVAAQIGAWRP